MTLGAKSCHKFTSGEGLLAIHAESRRPAVCRSVWRRFRSMRRMLRATAAPRKRDPEPVDGPASRQTPSARPPPRVGVRRVPRGGRRRGDEGPTSIHCGRCGRRISEAASAGKKSFGASRARSAINHQDTCVFCLCQLFSMKLQLKRKCPRRRPNRRRDIVWPYGGISLPNRTLRRTLERASSARTGPWALASGAHRAQAGTF